MPDRIIVFILKLTDVMLCVSGDIWALDMFTYDPLPAGSGFLLCEADHENRRPEMASGLRLLRSYLMPDTRR